MQIKTIMRYHFIPTRMARIRKVENNKHWWGKGENGNLYVLIRKQNGSVAVEVCWFLRKLKIELPHDPTILLLGMYPKELKTGIQTNTCTCMFIAALFMIVKR